MTAGRGHLGFAIMVATTAAGPCPVPAQGTLETPRPLTAQALRKTGVAPARPRGPIARIDCDADPERGLVAVSVPVMTAAPDVEWSFAQTGDGRMLLALAGGIEAPLDFWLIDRELGTYLRIPTQGGRRMPSSFNDGAGPWPLLQGRELILLAFERNGATQFRALDFSGAELAAVELSGEIGAFHYACHPTTHEVKVRFTGSSEVVSFQHPRSPRLEVASTMLDFGATPLAGERLRAVSLRNAGRSRLVARLSLPPGTPFALTRDRVELAPDAESKVLVRFAPKTEAVVQERLTVEAEGSVPRVVVLLQGHASDPAQPRTEPPPHEARPEAESRSRPQEPSLPELTEAGRPPEPAPEPVLPELTAGEAEVLVRARPGQELLFVVVAPDAFGRPSRVLRCWRGRARWDGTLRVPRQSLGDGELPIELFVLVERDGIQTSRRLSLPAR